MSEYVGQTDTATPRNTVRACSTGCLHFWGPKDAHVQIARKRFILLPPSIPPALQHTIYKLLLFICTLV